MGGRPAGRCERWAVERRGMRPPPTATTQSLPPLAYRSAGESYAGIYIPMLAHAIWMSNSAGATHIPLKGIIVGKSVSAGRVFTAWFYAAPHPRVFYAARHEAQRTACCNAPVARASPQRGGATCNPPPPPRFPYTRCPLSHPMLLV